MNIIYITGYRLPTERAHGLQIIKSCEAFACIGNTVRLFAPIVRGQQQDPFSYYSTERNFSFELIKTPWFSLLSERWAFYARSFLVAVIALLKTIWQAKKSLYYARGTVPLLVCALRGVKFVAEIHDYRATVPQISLRLILARAYAIVVNSEGTEKALCQHYDLSLRKVIVVPNGVDVKYFDIPQTEEDARRQLGIPNESTILGYVGSMETVGSEKGIRELLAAFRALRREGRNISLYIVGGPDDVVEEYRSLPGGHEAVFPGQISYAQVPLYLRAMDILVLPMPENRHSRTTSPIKLFEYMAAGKPIVASDIPGIRVHLDERNAFLFRAGDTEDLMQTISLVLDNPQQAAGLAKQARENAMHHTWEMRARYITSFIS